MQKNSSMKYSRSKGLKVKTGRRRSKTIGNRSKAASAIFNNVGNANCSATKSECAAFQRIIFILRLYNEFLSAYTSKYHQQQNKTHSNPTTPRSFDSGRNNAISPYASPRWDDGGNTLNVGNGKSPYDIVTTSNLRPSKTQNGKKKKSGKKFKIIPKKVAMSEKAMSVKGTDDTDGTQRLHKAGRPKSTKKYKKAQSVKGDDGDIGNYKSDNEATNDRSRFKRNKKKSTTKYKIRSKTPSGRGKGRKPAKSVGRYNNMPSTPNPTGSKKKSFQATGFYPYYSMKCGEYNNIHLINDFNHLSEFHKLEDMVYESCKQLNYDQNKCKSAECIALNRAYRDRLKCCKNNKFRKQIFLGFTDSNEVVTQQLMDKIHNFMLHTFDIGMKLDSRELETISNASNGSEESNYDDDDAKSFGTSDIPSVPSMTSSNSNNRGRGSRDDNLIAINSIINKKRDLLKQLTGNKYLNKFTSQIDQDLHEANNYAANNGHYAPRYYYWSIYADWDGTDKSNPGYNYCDWHIDPKYSSLKHELLSGPSKSMTKSQWHDLIALCGIYRHCDKIKTIKADFDDLHGYGIKRYTPIQTQHLLALMIYCNFHSIRKKFCRTYIRIPAMEDDDHLMERHSSFAHLARLLREAVEVFGQRTLFAKVKKFYHCLEKELMFRQTSGYFNMPTSTSINYETVINLDKKEGIVLQLKDNNDTHLNGGVRFFDMSWISDYSYEYEMLFISSLSALHIETIIQCNLGHNYGHFIHSLNVIYHMMVGRRYKNITNDGNDEMYKKCAFQLIQHQLFKNSVNHDKKKYVKYSNLPKYIENLMDYFFLNTLNVVINYDQLCDKNHFKLFDSLFVGDKKYVKLDAMLILFPNVRKINVNAIKGKLQFDDHIFATILKTLSSRTINPYLQEIVFKDALRSSIDDSVGKYESKYLESRWIVTQQHSTLMIKQSAFDVV